ncbi:MAG: SDR family NAD(P)-dependent oxidoreductase, partial [Pseudomonadota bacterium]
MRFEGKTVWVTGASSGIGEAVSRAFAAEGANVILSGRRVEALETVAAQIEGDTLILPFEVTDYDTLQDSVDAAWEWKGRIDILVNNAGVSQRSLAIDTAPEVYRDLINIDLIAPIWLTQLQLSRMAAAGGAHIVAISSLAGRIGSPLRTAYSAAKHGLIGYMDALRSEMDTLHNIKVTNVLPGS